MSQGVFRLRSSVTGQATGFLISRRLLLTAAHCVGSDGEAHVENKSGLLKGEAVSIWRDARLDAALLALKEPFAIDAAKYVVPIRALPKDRLIAGLRWHAPGYAVGDPERLGLELTGALAGIQADDGARRLQLSCDQFGNSEGGIAGSSGSPVMVNLWAIAFISRSPKSFLQRVVFGTLLEDVLQASRATVSEEYREEVESVLSTVAPLELDEGDRAANRYVARLEALGRAFHERAVRTPGCSTQRIEQACLQATYVPIRLQPVRDPRELWVEAPESGCACTTSLLEPPATIDGTIKSMAANGSRLQALITGYAGSGKTTLLNYIASTALVSPSEIGLERPMTPLLLSLPELARAKCTSNLTDWLLAIRETGASACDLPAADWRFVTEIPGRLNAPLLVLLDGLEEVPEPLQRDLWRSFRMCIVEQNLSWIMASRPPTSHEDPVNDISQRAFVKTYKILPWTDKDLWLFAVAVLGKQSVADFIQQFRLMTLGRSTMTPLLALIAMCVYEKNPTQLPRTRAELLELFIDNAILRGSEKHNPQQPMGRDERSELIGLLAPVALFMTESLSCSHVDDVITHLAKVLHGPGRRSAAKAKASAKRAREVLDVAGLQSGLLAVDDRGRVVWWHASLREYLAAWALADGTETERMHRLIQSCEPQWLEVVVMMLVILSVRHGRQPSRCPDVTRYFAGLVAKGDTGMVVYPALAEGAAVSEDMELFIITNLVDAAIRIGRVSECREFNQELTLQGRSPVQMLLKLRKRTRRATDGIRLIRDHPEVLDWMREDARVALNQIEQES